MELKLFDPVSVRPEQIGYALAEIALNDNFTVFRTSADTTGLFQPTT